MKKSFVRLLTLFFLSALLISCDGAKTKPEKESAPADRAGDKYTQEQLEILKITDKELAEKFGIRDLSVFEVYVNTFNNDNISVSYSLLLEGVFTNEQYFVHLDKDLNIIESKSSNVGKYSKYLNDLSFKQSFSAAKAKIEEQTASYTETNNYYFTEEEGYLCLCSELIVDIEPSSDSENGCGIDHEHLFFTERILPLS